MPRVADPWSILWMITPTFSHSYCIDACLNQLGARHHNAPYHVEQTKSVRTGWENHEYGFGIQGKGLQIRVHRYRYQGFFLPCSVDISFVFWFDFFFVYQHYCKQLVQLFKCKNNIILC